MDVCVLVLNWRNERDTVSCVQNLRSWKFLKPEILVVDNQSSEPSKNTLSAFLDAGELICSESNLGFGGGNNLGIRRALERRAKYLLLLNSDVELGEADATGLIERLEASPEISILGPVIHERRYDGGHCCIGGRDIARNVATRIDADGDALGAIPGYPLHDVDYVPGAVFLVRSTVFEQVGLLDERYFFGGEMADFCKRARESGHRACVDLEVSAQHDATRVSSHTRETLYAYYSLRNRFLYTRKHYPTEMPKHLAFWTGVCAREFGRSLRKRQMARSRAILLALMHGYANRSGNQNAAFM